jgi:soluble cytochrome b562
MTDGLNPAVLAAIEATPETRTTQLKALRDAVAEVRELEKVKADLEERLKATNIELQDFYFKKLVTLLDEAGVTEIILTAEGNMPEVKATAKPFYRANISSDWPDDKRRAAFDWLDQNGHGDLIKTEVNVVFNREQRSDALKFAEEQRQTGKTVIPKENIPWATLTAWLKEMVEKKGIMPPLETIGGTVGRVVALKPKDK